MHRFIAFSIVLILAGGCKTSGNDKGAGAGLDSVDIPQTGIRDQGQIGFCWSYGTIALVESMVQLKSGRSIDLSEEALGFYRILHGLESMAATTIRPDDPIFDDVTKPHAGNTFLDEQWSHSAVALLDRYGVVPENVWSVKFTTDAQVRAMKSGLRAALKSRVARMRRNGGSLSDSISRDEFLAMMTTKGAFRSAPPQSFVVDGRRYSAREYLRSLDFDPSGFAVLETKSPSDLGALIAATKRALVRGVAVPFIYPVEFDRLKFDRFTAPDGSRADSFSIFNTHIVLITDFVNRGGRAGAISADELGRELAKSSDELDYFIFKNSWGPIGRDNRHKIDMGYLKYSASAVIEDTHVYYEGIQPEPRGALRVFVPKDIAADPFGAEPVNPKVSLP
jgi:hypothetical protein